jgi:hypothetical protein
MQSVRPQPVFLTARWRRLVMANYEIDPYVLLPYLPYGTELDVWQDRHYVSLVGFLFQDTRLKGFSIPFHRNFEEINLRFYVRYKDPELGWKRGTVFIKEIVPKMAITLVANTIYREHYQTMPTRHIWKESEENLLVEYGWKHRGQWQYLRVNADPEPQAMDPESEAAFITEHYWGYVQLNGPRTTEYEVEHPSWRIHEVRDYDIRCNGAALYGPSFAEALAAEPLSVFLAEGSEIIVRAGRRIQVPGTFRLRSR